MSVTPTDVQVEVEGVAVPIEGGAVRVEGKAGSVYRVRVKKGSGERVREVVLREEGAIVPGIDLGAPREAR